MNDDMYKFVLFSRKESKKPLDLVTDGPSSYVLVLAGQTRAKHSAIVHPKTDCFIKV